MTAFTKLLFLRFSLQVDVRKPWVLLHKIFYWNHLSDIISVLRRHVVDPGWSDKTDQYIFPIQILELSRHLVRAEQSHIRPIKTFWNNEQIVVQREHCWHSFTASTYVWTYQFRIWNLEEEATNISYQL